jgi:ATP-binding cassette subfamily B protein
MKYKLNKDHSSGEQKNALRAAYQRLLPLMQGEGKNLSIAFISIVFSSAGTLLSPIIISHAIDTYILGKDWNGVLLSGGLLLLVGVVGLVAGYIQTITMGGVGRRVLFNLRAALFEKLQELPVAFFNQNKAGDLISRINNDTDKLNQFFAQALIQFIANFFLILGGGIFLLLLNIKLGAAALVPAVFVLLLTQLLSPWVKRTSLASLQSLGGLSAEVSESLSNFRVIVAFNRLDYFRNKFNEANIKNYKASITAGVASNIFTPLYSFASAAAQLIVLWYGIVLISNQSLSVGLLIAFFLYVTNFYNPLRQLASIWQSLQLALAALDRISEVLAMRSDMEVLPAIPPVNTKALLQFKNVFFSYPPLEEGQDSKTVLRDISFDLLPGKTYALVGPTGGGKTTTASLMARLFDATEGTVLLEGRDIRTWSNAERTKKIGFILQEPFLFTGTVADNIVYGNAKYINAAKEELAKVITDANLSGLLARFDQGLETNVTSSSDSISLGQKQLIAFMRAVLREPDLLILDEATANIDTVTEQLLEDILKKLPKSTTRVIIAHRLNTIENADEIFFVNGGEITLAGDMEHAVEMLLHGKRGS